MEAAYNRKEVHQKAMCKHCKSMAHGTLEHRKHYKNFRAEKKEQREEKHMKMFGVEAGKGNNLHKKGLPKTYDGKSTKLGHGGRAAKLRDEGVPGAVIGAIARSKGAAPGGPHYHGKHKKAMSESDAGSMKGYDPNLGLGKVGMKQLQSSSPKGYGTKAAPKMRVQPVQQPKLHSRSAGKPVDGGMGSQSEVFGQGGGAGGISGSTRMNTAALGGANMTRIKSKSVKKK